MLVLGGVALANKRIRKKKEKERAQRQLVRTQKYSEKELHKKSYNDLLSISDKESKRQARKEYKNKLRRRKIDELESIGFERSQFTLSSLDKIKIKDLESGNFNRENYSWFFGIDKFDFDKIYTLKNGEVVQFAFRDFAGETDLESILKDYDKLSNAQLLDRLSQLNNIQPTYTKGSRKGSKKGGTSSGAAGDYKFLCGSKSAAIASRQETNSENKRVKYHPMRKAHGAQIYNGYQFLKPNRRSTFTNKITSRRLLEITCAFMENVTEWDRVYFYRRIYNDLVARHMPDLLPLLPYPQ